MKWQSKGPNMASVAASWRQIEEVHFENAHTVFRNLRKPATNTAIERLCGILPSKLPRDFIQSLKIHDGLRNSYLGQVRIMNYWALLPVTAIVGEWKMMNSLQLECEFEGNPAARTARIKNDAHWRPGWVPIMDADGDKIILDLDPGPEGIVGQVFRWSNCGSSPDRIVADSFRKLWCAIATAFANREFRLGAFGGIWLDELV
jgi:cell wall assembly regulator SMI1